jgi:hypothetical protein
MLKEESKGIPNAEAAENLTGLVNVAGALLRLDVARGQGLITNGPDVRVDDCVALLRYGRSLNVEPCRLCVERIIAGAIDSEGLEPGFAERFAAKLFEQVSLVY